MYPREITIRESRLSWCFPQCGVVTPRVFITRESRLPGDENTSESTNLKLVYKNLIMQNTLWSHDSHVTNTQGNFYSLAYLLLEVFLCKPAPMLVPNHQEVDSQCFYNRGVETPWCIPQWGVILDTGKSFYQIEREYNNL